MTTGGTKRHGQTKMGSKHRTLQDLVLHQLKDLHYAERHMGKMLSKMAKAAASADVRAAFERRHDAVVAHADTLEALFGSLDKKPHDVPCEAMDGIVAETKAMIDDFGDGPAIDAGLVGAAQAMEHYVIARYTALRAWTGQLGLAGTDGPIAALLDEARHALDAWASLAGAAARTAPASGRSPMTLKQAALVGIG